MDINARYLQILESLEKGGRGLHRYDHQEMQELQTEFDRSLRENDQEQLEKVLCLLDHSATNNPDLEKNLIQALKADLPDRLTVFALNASRKHIIEARFQRGLRLDFEYLESLKALLHSPSPEVVEWTLRTIEECSNQGIYFLREFDKIKPPPWKWFNAHQRAVREIITLLERRWRRFEKPKS